MLVTFEVLTSWFWCCGWVVLVSPCGTLHESTITIDFPVTNNEAEYEAPLGRLRSTIHMKFNDLSVFYDLQLIVNQVLADYEAQDSRMLKYQATASTLIKNFKTFKIEQISRELNSHANTLASLASACTTSKYQTINFRNIEKLTFEVKQEVLNVKLGLSWMN